MGTKYSGLPSDRELGRMNRRHVLRALGLGATGAALAACGPGGAGSDVSDSTDIPAGELGQTFPVVNVQHLSLAAADYVKSRDFYIKVFGMKDAWDNGSGCAVEFGSPGMPNGFYIRPVREDGEAGVGHIAFGIPNITVHLDAMKVEMERRKLENIRPDGEHGWISDDPNGYMLNTWVPAEPSHAMFPGAARPCRPAPDGPGADSAECHEAFEAGLNTEAIKAAPTPEGSSFKAFAFNYVVLNCADIAKGREFYENCLGMKVIYDQPDQAFLRFGQETLILRPAGADGVAYVNHYGFAIENYDHAAVKAELDRLGLAPKAHTDRSWTIMDPDGMQVEISGWGFAEYLANECQGSAENCPTA
jgi:catechol 2,3-dioxygenase-like lactoylglutathione lyase family enzyme